MKIRNEWCRVSVALLYSTTNNLILFPLRQHNWPLAFRTNVEAWHVTCTRQVAQEPPACMQFLRTPAPRSRAVNWKLCCGCPRSQLEVRFWTRAGIWSSHLSLGGSRVWLARLLRQIGVLHVVPTLPLGRCNAMWQLADKIKYGNARVSALRGRCVMLPC
jgi:hypothetical protein